MKLGITFAVGLLSSAALAQSDDTTAAIRERLNQVGQTNVPITWTTNAKTDTVACTVQCADTKAADLLWASFKSIENKIRLAQRTNTVTVVVPMPNGAKALPQQSDRPMDAQSSSQKAGRSVCIACGGTGTVPCRAGGCSAGKVDCPGPCLKLSRGDWVHLNVAGHDPKELWQKFSTGDGKYTAWSQGHVGEVVEIQNGQPINIGRCKVCGGTGKVDCTVCKGTGKLTCTRCAGTGRS